MFDAGLPLLRNVNLDFKLQLSSVKQLNANTVELHYTLK